MSTKSPAFQFYPDDFLGSGKVGTMTTEEVGAYALLLCLEWNETGFIYDEEELSRWCRMSRLRFRKAWARVSRCFTTRDGRLYNPRLDAEREKQAIWREKSRKGGITSGQHRAKGGSTTLEPPLEPNDKGGSTTDPTKDEPKGNTPSPSPTPVTTTTQTDAVREAASPLFVLAWTAYPPRAGSNPRRSAEKSWRARVREGVSEADMFAGVERYRAYCEARGIIGTDFVQQGQRFFGPNREFEGEWAPTKPERTIDPTRPLVDEYGSLTAYGEQVTMPDAIRRGMRVV